MNKGLQHCPKTREFAVGMLLDRVRNIRAPLARALDGHGPAAVKEIDKNAAAIKWIVTGRIAIVSGEMEDLRLLPAGTDVFPFAGCRSLLVLRSTGWARANLDTIGIGGQGLVFAVLDRPTDFTSQRDQGVK